MAYGDFKYLSGRISCDTKLRDKVFGINKNPKYNGYQKYCASIVYKVFH